MIYKYYVMSNFDEYNKIILYDGVCVLCNKWVNFIIKNDKNEIFKFCPLQSKTSKKILKKFKIPDDDFDTIYILKDGKILDVESYCEKNTNFWFLRRYF